MFTGKFNEGPIKSRLHKTPCCPLPLCLPMNTLLSPLRRSVSKKKRRFKQDGFDLDLTYVTDRIIVHGFPAVGVEHLYRNPRNEVRRFLEKKHAGHYKVFNFCCEPGRGYPASFFDGRVERYPFRDHGVPPLDTMSQFCNSAKAWLDADPKNVVSLHCKAGKGRAGIMCCCLLVRTGFRQTALEAMDYYDKTRVVNNRGLTVTSQRKFVLLYERLWRDVWELPRSMDIGKSPTEDKPEERYPIPKKGPMDVTSCMIIDLPPCFAKDEKMSYQFKIILGTTSKHFDFSVAGVSDIGDKDKVFFLRANISDNFAVQLWGIKSGGLFGGKKKKKLAEMWCNVNWLNYSESQTYFDFPVAELNIKKKLRKKVGNSKFTIRIGFGDYQQNVSRESALSISGHAMLGKAGADDGDLEMQPIVPRLDQSFSVQL